MKLLIVNSLYPPYIRGGAEQSVRHLAEGLRRAGIEVVVAATVPRQEARRESIGDVVVHFLPAWNWYWPYDNRQHAVLTRKLWQLIDLYNPAMRAALAAVIRREKPDVVHTNNLQAFSVSVWDAARTLKRPLLHTLRDYSLSCVRACRFRDGVVCDKTCWDCQPFVAVRRRLSAAVDGVVGNSADILARHRNLRFFPKARFHGAIHPSLARDESVSAAGRGAQTVPSVRFGYMGRLEAAKGVELLLGTFAQLPDDGWELHLAGEGSPDYERQLRDQLRRAPGAARIRFRGWVEATRFLAEIDVLIVPSLWHEPLPRVIIEAAAQGVPTIASARGGITEIVVDGVTGLLFDPNQPRGLQESVTRLLKDPALRHQLAASARQAAMAIDPDTTVHRYLEVYEQLHRRGN